MLSSKKIKIGSISNQVTLGGAGGTNITVLTAPTPSANRTYTIPDTGANSNFVMTDLAQTINGDKTFTGNIQLSDKLITLNKGGLASSGTGVGFEIEENSLITGYFKTVSSRTGWDSLVPGNANVLTLNQSLLTTSRVLTFPDAMGVFVVKPTGTNAVANQIPYWTDTNTITSSSGSGADSFTWDFTNHRLGIATSSPSVALDVNGSARIRGLTTAGFVKTDASGNLSSTQYTVLTTDVSGVLPIANGGTNNSTNLANGQLWIGNGTATPSIANITQDTNLSVTINNTAGAIKLGTVQDIRISASPSFVSISLTNNTNQLVLGTTNTLTISTPILSSSWTLTLPTTGGTNNYSLITNGAGITS